MFGFWVHYSQIDVQVISNPRRLADYITKHMRFC